MIKNVEKALIANNVTVLTPNSQYQHDCRLLKSLLSQHIRQKLPAILEEARRKTLYEFFDWNYGTDSWSKTHVEAFLNLNHTEGE